MSQQAPHTGYSLSPAAHAGATIMEQCLVRTLRKMLERAHERRLDAPPDQSQHFQSRATLAFSYFEDRLVDIFDWLFRSREDTNFTYDVTDKNKKYTAALVSVVTGRPIHQVHTYIDELVSDEELRNHVRQATLQRPERGAADLHAHYGRRIGWYAFVRASKPRVVVETGVEKGLGSVVLVSALMRNAQEGYPGQYFGTDIDPHAGYLLSGRYRDFGTILYGDSIQSLSKLAELVDLFINDSNHSADYESAEYRTIDPKLSPSAIIIGDNAHVTDRLFQFAQDTGRRYLFSSEMPEAHWYPGAGMGVAWR